MSAPQEKYSKSSKEEAGDSYIAEYDVLDEHNLVMSILSTTYQQARIERWVQDLDNIVTKPYTLNSSIALCNIFGRRVEKLKIYMNDFAENNLRHLYGTLLLCLDLISDGYEIHLIESISNEEIKKMGDIDIFASFNSEIHLFDYTQIKNNNIYHAQNPEKMFILEQKFQNVTFQAHVSSRQLPSWLWDITMKDTQTIKGNFKSQFLLAQNLVDFSQQLSSTDAKLLLDDYSVKVDSAVGKGSNTNVRTLPKGDSSASSMIPAAIRMIGHNDVRSSIVYNELIDKICKTEESREDYSANFLNEIENCEEKPIFNFPLAARNVGITSNNPFTRLSLISDAIQSHGGLVNPLIQLLVWSLDGEMHPTELEKETLKHNPLFFMYDGIFVQRNKTKTTGALMNSVRLFFKGEYKSLRSLAYGDEKTKHVVNKMRYRKTTHNYVQLEEKLASMTAWCKQPSVGSRYYEDIDRLIDCVLPDSDVASTLRKCMSQVMQGLYKTQLGSMISFVQEVATSVCNSPRKKRLARSSHGGFNQHICDLSLDCVTDRFAVSLTNMSSLLNTHKDQTVSVAGYFPGTGMEFSRSHVQGLSEWFNVSGADLDWHTTLVHKLISWLSLEVEETLINEPSPSPEMILNLYLYPSLIMTINDQKFAQASEMVRYIFVNSTGISGGTKNLYEKIRWYKPNDLVSKLYLCRMIKMSTGIQWLKAVDARSDMMKPYQVNIQDGEHLSKTFHFRHWKVAFPHEEHYIPSDLHVYNSFYICKAFTVERHNKMLSEALVIKKQLESRRAFMDIYRQNRDHELSFLPDFQSVDELKEYCLQMDYGNMVTEAYSPSPIVVMLGSLATLLKTHKHFDSVLEIVDKEYQTRELPRSLKLSDIMNNHGSVASKGTHGLIVTNKKKVEKVKVGKKVVETHINTQNDKAYHTLLRDVHDFVTEAPAKSCPLDWKQTKIEYEDVMPSTESILKEALRANNLIWPLVARHLVNFTQFVSKMTHKDQISQREIATLNAAARICCYYVEEFARLIRDTEHKSGTQTNVIERKDKETIVKGAFNKSRLSSSEGETVIYDSADCSKWGPSMLSPIMYISLGMRISDGFVRNSILRSLSLFSNKIFKIPDHFFLNFDQSSMDPETTNAVDEVRQMLRNMVWPMGDSQRQIINLPESMHQGILGATSSVLGSDMLNLSRYVTHEIFDNITVESFCTSDDYTRIITISGLDQMEDSFSRIIKRSLSLHVKVSNDFGIKRNMEKSSHSTTVMEFNSVFYTPSSENRPDIKSRLSYVDFGHSYDPYPNALECLNKGTEFLRSEGSLHGACWVQLLNTHLSMMQNQSLPLFNTLNKGIFEVPLELGGYPMIDPIAAIYSTKYIPLVNNYCPTTNWDPKAALRVMMELRPDEVEEISLDPTDSMKSRVPKMSRSGTIHLCRRDKRESRKVREFLQQVPREFYTDLRFPGSKYSLLPSLMACMQREESTGSGESSSIRYSVPQTPMDALCYRLNSKLLTGWLTDQLVSRRQLHQLAEDWHIKRILGLLATDEEIVKLDDPDIPLFYENFVLEHTKYLSRLASIKIVKILPVNKRTHLHPIRETFVPSTWYDSVVQDFCVDYKPVELGGNTNMHPSLFLESVMMFKAKMRDMVSRKQIIKLVLLEQDSKVVSLLEKILLGGFMNGCRTIYDINVENVYQRPVEDFVGHIMKLITKPNWDDQWGIHGDITWDILDDRISTLMKNKRLAHFDLTTLLNASMGTTEFLTFSDTRSKMEIWHILFEVFSGKTGRKLVLSPHKIDFNRQHEVFKIGSLSSLYSNPLTPLGAEIIGKETIQEDASGCFNHYYFQTKEGDIRLPNATQHDTHNLLDVSSLDYVNVMIKNINGFLVLTTTNGFPISILCSSLPEHSNTVYLHFQQEFLTKDLINKLGLNNPYSGVSPALRKILYSNLMLFHEDEVVVDEHVSEQLDLREEQQLQEEMNHLQEIDDDGLDFDFDDIMNDIFEMEDEIPTEPNIYDDYGHGVLEEEEVGPQLLGETSSVWSRPETTTSYISAYGVFQPTSTLMSTRAYGQLSLVPQNVRRSMKFKKKTERTYEIHLPFDTGEKFYESGPTGTGLTSFVADLSALETVDSVWYLSYIRDCLVNDPELMIAVKRVLETKDIDDEESDWSE